MILEFSRNTLALYLEAAPWLLLGLISAGLIKAWVPEGRMNRWLGGRGPWPVVKAALIGAPLPLCSCGVLPAALGLRRAGASRGATVSFLIATPETGVDSIAVSYALLGPFMAVVRPVAAITSAIATGLLAAVVPEAKAARPLFNIAAQPVAVAGDCGCSGSCTPARPVQPTVWGLGLKGLHYALTDILDDIALWLLIGLLAAGAIATWVPPLALAQWGSGLPAMLLMLLVGVPMYICATASTPLGAGLLLAGVSPGTVLVFLLAGPATNIATLAVVKRELGRAALWLYLVGIAGSSIVLGLLTDLLVRQFDIDIRAELGAGAELVPAWLAWASALLLLVFAIKPVRRHWLH